ncbi:MAG: hypothetical protein ACUVR2_11490, partial [Anaerolineae bacterium]
LLVTLSIRHMVAQEAMHPLSLETIQTTYRVVSNPHARMPEERRTKLKAYLAGFGIHSEATFQERYAQFMEQARAENLRHPNAAGKPFVPIISFLSP